MKLKIYTEQILTVLLVVVVLPWMITMLLHSRMSQIYEKIQSETRFISVKSGSETEEISLEEYEERDEIAEHLQIWKNQLTTGRTALSQYELISGQYEEAASRLEETKKKKAAPPSKNTSEMSVLFQNTPDHKRSRKT